MQPASLKKKKTKMEEIEETMPEADLALSNQGKLKVPKKEKKQNLGQSLDENKILWKGFVLWRQADKEERMFMMVNSVKIFLVPRMVRDLADAHHLQKTEIPLESCVIREWLQTLTITSNEKILGILTIEPNQKQIQSEFVRTIRHLEFKIIRLLRRHFTGWVTKGKFKRGKPRFFKRRWVFVHSNLFRISYFVRQPETEHDVSSFKGSFSLLGCSIHESDMKFEKFPYTVDIENPTRNRWCFAFDNFQEKCVFKDKIAQIIQTSKEIVKKAPCKTWISLQSSKRRGAINYFAVLLPFSIVMFHSASIQNSKEPNLKTIEESETINLIGCQLIEESTEREFKFKIIEEDRSSYFIISLPNKNLLVSWLKGIHQSFQFCTSYFPFQQPSITLNTISNIKEPSFAFPISPSSQFNELSAAPKSGTKSPLRLSVQRAAFPQPAPVPAASPATSDANTPQQTPSALAPAPAAPLTSVKSPASPKCAEENLVNQLLTAPDGSKQNRQSISVDNPAVVLRRVQKMTLNDKRKVTNSVQLSRSDAVELQKGNPLDNLSSARRALTLSLPDFENEEEELDAILKEVPDGSMDPIISPGRMESKKQEEDMTTEDVLNDIQSLLRTTSTKAISEELSAIQEQIKKKKEQLETLQMQKKLQQTSREREVATRVAPPSPVVERIKDEW